MAEVMEGAKHNHEHEIPWGKINGGLTTGIIGTSLAGLMALGALLNRRKRKYPYNTLRG